MTFNQWALAVAGGLVLLIAAVLILDRHFRQPKGKHAAPRGETGFDIERVWLNEDELTDAVWRQENLRFEEAVGAYHRLNGVLTKNLSADAKTGAGPLRTQSKSAIVESTLALLVSDDQDLADLETVASWVEKHPGKAAFNKLASTLPVEG